MAKNINYFLMDGTPNGPIKCTIANWTGVAYRIPRTELEKCKERNDLKQSGVYFLFGIDADTDNEVVYVGQAGARKNGEGVLYRLQEHRRNTDKGYWSDAVVFTTSNNSFSPTEISWLENCFYALAKKAERYDVKNNVDTPNVTVTEEKASELEEFAEYSKIVMGVLGYKVFDPKSEILSKPQSNISIIDSARLYLKRATRKSDTPVEGVCIRRAGEFVVLKGSRMELIDSEHISSGIISRRKTAKKDSSGVLQEDVVFKSPSSAASFITGGSANGLTEWKLADGTTLKELESRESAEEIIEE